MPLNSYDTDELRDHCRRHLERLEAWVRRLIHDEFTQKYGSNYLEAKLPDDSFLLNSGIRTHIRERLNQNPDRFSRPIDAAMLEQEIAIICNPRLYDEHFDRPLEKAFPLGHDHARETLTRLVEPRNRLYHANPISVRQAERIICYSGDTIDSLKAYYEEAGMERDYVVPMIVRVTDNFGNEYHDNDLHRNRTGRASLNLRDDDILKLRPGDIYRVQVEVHNPDPDSSYSVNWVVPTQGSSEPQEGTEFVLEVSNDHVRTDFGVFCRVVSDKDWHRCGDVDDALHIPLKVLPPAT